MVVRPSDRLGTMGVRKVRGSSFSADRACHTVCAASFSVPPLLPHSLRNRMTRRFSLTLLLLAAMAAPLASQEVDGILLDGRRQTPVPGARVTLLDAVGELAARVTTRADGRFRFRVDAGR